jgi:hypothetical protein
MPALLPPPRARLHQPHQPGHFTDFAGALGITVLYPTRFLLYQGPLPNLPLIDAPEPLSSIMAGLDYPRTDASELIGEQPHSRAVLNVIMRIPRQPDRPVEISAGQPLAWFMLVPKKQRMLAL